MTSEHSWERFRPRPTVTQRVKETIQRALGTLGYELRRKQRGDTFLVQRMLTPSDAPVVFDVGAHVGQTAKNYRLIWPNASIHCFEPYQECFLVMKADLCHDSRAFLHQLAIADKEATLLFNCNSFSQTNSLLATDAGARKYWGDGLYETRTQVEVQATTIDAFCAKQGIGSIDILKLDIQGAEFLALIGAAEMLRRKAIGLVYMEVILAPTYTRQHKFHEYLELFDSVGYTLLDLYNPVRVDQRLIQADVIFVPEIP